MDLEPGSEAFELLRELLREKLPEHESKQRHAATSCSGKHAYPSAAIARGAIRTRYENEVEVYRCSVCSAFHIGNTDKGRRRRKLRRFYLCRPNRAV